MTTQSRAADGRFQRDPAILDTTLELGVHNAIEAAPYLPTYAERNRRPRSQNAIHRALRGEADKAAVREGQGG